MYLILFFIFFFLYKYKYNCVKRINPLPKFTYYLFTIYLPACSPRHPISCRGCRGDGTLVSAPHWSAPRDDSEFFWEFRRLAIWLADATLTDFYWLSTLITDDGGFHRIHRDWAPIILSWILNNILLLVNYNWKNVIIIIAFPSNLMECLAFLIWCQPDDELT